MTKNLGRDFVYGYETKPVGVKPRRTLFGVGIGSLVPLVAVIAALLIGRYFFSL